MSDTPPRDQAVTRMNASDEARLREQRAVVEKYLADDDSREKYKTAAGKLGTLRAILAAKVFAPAQTYELQ